MSKIRILQWCNYFIDLQYPIFDGNGYMRERLWTFNIKLNNLKVSNMAMLRPSCKKFTAMASPKVPSH